MCSLNNIRKICFKNEYKYKPSVLNMNMTIAINKIEKSLVSQNFPLDRLKLPIVKQTGITSLIYKLVEFDDVSHNELMFV